MIGPSLECAPVGVSSRGQEAAEFAASLGLELDPWQQVVLDRALGVREDGKWAAFEVALVVPRQNGKGAVLEARELFGLFVLGEPLIIHSAHQFDTSQEHFRRLEALIDDAEPAIRAQVKKITHSHGEEGIELRNGCRIRFRTRTKGGGRGFTCDCLVLDEAMFLPEFTFGALLPTLSSKSITGNPQVWYAGSPVDQEIHEDGLILAQRRERAQKGDPRSLVYFEWSAPVEDLSAVTDEVAGSLEMWTAANPGLGIRISEEHIEREREAMLPRSFAVERLGVGDWPRTDLEPGGMISVDAWNGLADPQSSLVDPVVFAWDVSPDRRASIAAAGRRDDGRLHVEIVENRGGTKWIADRIVELARRWDVSAFVCDEYGPAGSTIEEVEAAGVEVQKLTARDHAQACGLLIDLVDEDRLRHLGSEELRAAVRGAKTRPLGDAFAWSRRNSSVDISPLVAATLALWRAAAVESASAYEGRGLVLI